MDKVLTAKESHLTNTLDELPPAGSNVLALSHGGKLCEVVWKSDSHLYFDGWAKYPTVPRDIKERQLARFK